MYINNGCHIFVCMLVFMGMFSACKQTNVKEVCLAEKMLFEYNPLTVELDYSITDVDSVREYLLQKYKGHEKFSKINIALTNYGVTMPVTTYMHDLDYAVCVNRRNVCSVVLNEHDEISVANELIGFDNLRGMVQKFYMNNGLDPNLSDDPCNAIIHIRWHSEASADLIERVFFEVYSMYKATIFNNPYFAKIDSSNFCSLDSVRIKVLKKEFCINVFAYFKVWESSDLSPIDSIER